MNNLIEGIIAVNTFPMAGWKEMMVLVYTMLMCHK